ncbi:discoidin domain-containing protein [Tenacibaculum amylolyticum]|uniref:discoidin domain-containing protein n=1 Tax=Tenacibaculum amylolyticum TaxID=104269 RepID=UPI003894639C
MKKNNSFLKSFILSGIFFLGILSSCNTEDSVDKLEIDATVKAKKLDNTPITSSRSSNTLTSTVLSAASFTFTQRGSNADDFFSNFNFGELYDGNTSNGIGVGRFTGGNTFFDLDIRFNSPITINDLTIYGRFTGYQVFLFNENGSTTPSSLSTSTSDKVSFTNNNPSRLITGIRIRFRGSSGILLVGGLFEIEITTPNNLASNQPVALSTSSPTPGDFGANNLVDGNLFDLTHTNDFRQAWARIDLGRNYQLDRIVIFNRTDNCCVNRLGNFNVIASTNPINEIDNDLDRAVEGLNNGITTPPISITNIENSPGFVRRIFDSTGGRSVIGLNFSGETARYVYVLQESSNVALNLREIQIFGREVSN